MNYWYTQQPVLTSTRDVGQKKPYQSSAYGWSRLYGLLEQAKLVNGEGNQSSFCLWEWYKVGKFQRDFSGAIEMFSVFIFKYF